MKSLEIKKGSRSAVVDKYKCPKCGSGRTKPISMVAAGGTRRRQTVGFSRRNLWTSTSTYKSDLVRSLPSRPSNAAAYGLIFAGGCGLLLALMLGSGDSHAIGIVVFFAVASILLLLGGFAAKKSPDALVDEQAAWDDTWLCSRCGYRWQA